MRASERTHVGHMLKPLSRQAEHTMNSGSLLKTPIGLILFSEVPLVSARHSFVYHLI